MRFYCLEPSFAWSAGPDSGVLLSVTFGSTTSSQIGFGPTMLVKLHSFLVAAEAACSNGDFPVVTEDAMLAAVIGLATAAPATVVPAELAAAVPVVPIAAKGAMHPCRIAFEKINMQNQVVRMDRGLLIYSACKQN